MSKFVDSELSEARTYLWKGQPLRSFRPLLRVGAGVRFRGKTRPVQRLQADLGAEQVSDGLQGAAGIRGQ